MKQIIIILLLALFTIICQAEEPLKPDHYRINGTVTGLEKGEILLDTYPYSGARVVIEVKNGKFVIEREFKDIACMIHILADREDDKSSLTLLIEPNIMDLNLDYNDFSKSKLTGSKTQNDKYKLDDIIKDRAATREFIKNNPKSFAIVEPLFVLVYYKEIKYEEAKALLDQINPEHLKIGYGTELVKAIEDMRKGIPGAKAGDFDTVDINGNPIKLADFKGRYLLIDFWASWCAPCRGGHPHLLNLYAKYKDKGFEILGVASDDDAPEKWRDAVNKDGINAWRHVLKGEKFDKSNPAGKPLDKGIDDGYRIISLPTKILVNPEGIIIGRYGSGGENNDAMDKKLAELFE